MFDDCVDTRWSGKEGMASGHTGNRCVLRPPAPILGKIDSVAFAVATCPNCSRQFRLVWRIGKRRITPLQRLRRLVCPLCGNAFEDYGRRAGSALVRNSSQPPTLSS